MHHFLRGRQTRSPRTVKVLVGSGMISNCLHLSGLDNPNLSDTYHFLYVGLAEDSVVYFNCRHCGWEDWYEKERFGSFM